MHITSLIFNSLAGVIQISINPFVPNAPFLYPLKTSESLTVLWCFQGVEKGLHWERMGQGGLLISFHKLICWRMKQYCISWNHRSRCERYITIWVNTVHYDLTYQHVKSHCTIWAICCHMELYWTVWIQMLINHSV